MTVRVRFAPSPTGYLHIGGARTALYSYLYAKSNKGVCILRIEDTDVNRSKTEYEDAIIDDLNWLGIKFDEYPGSGDYGPYRQSERLDIYKKFAYQLVEDGYAYPCFLSQEELDKLSEKAKNEKKAPHAYHNKYRKFDKDKAKKKIQEGHPYSIRFKNPQKTYSFYDLVRGEVRYGPDMVGDFVIIRSNNMPVYNFCCVIDDYLMKISHVIRAEEHLNNTLRQLMIYEALSAKTPNFAHCSLLVGEDNKKLSKRHEGIITSIYACRKNNYLPQALSNYLCLLGWSHPEEKDIFDINDSLEFSLDRLTKAPALYDMKKLNYYNNQYLNSLEPDILLAHAKFSLKKESMFFKQNQRWQKDFLNLFIKKVDLITELEKFIDEIFNTKTCSSSEYKEIISWSSTSIIRNYICKEIKNRKDNLSVDDFNSWISYLKTKENIKGKQLFKGIRAVLTLNSEGADLKALIPLTPIEVLKNRLSI